MDWPRPFKDREKRISLFLKMTFATLPASAIGMLIHPAIGTAVFALLSMPFWLYVLWGICSIATIGDTLQYSIGVAVIAIFMISIFEISGTASFVLLAIVVRLIGGRLPEFGNW